MYTYIYQIFLVTKHSFLPIAVVCVVKMFLCYDTLFRQQNVRYWCGMIGAVTLPEKENKKHEVSEMGITVSYLNTLYLLMILKMTR